VSAHSYLPTYLSALTYLPTYLPTYLIVLSPIPTRSSPPSSRSCACQLIPTYLLAPAHSDLLAYLIVLTTYLRTYLPTYPIVLPHPPPNAYPLIPAVVATPPSPRQRYSALAAACLLLHLRNSLSHWTRQSSFSITISVPGRLKTYAAFGGGNEWLIGACCCIARSASMLWELLFSCCCGAFSPECKIKCLSCGGAFSGVFLLSYSGVRCGLCTMQGALQH
jgi:hypothetical protein